jgi:ribosome-associated protein
MAAQAAAEKKAYDIQILDISNLLVITDYFVICSGSNVRQVRTISDFIQEKLKKEKVYPLSVQGEREAKWVLLDYVDFVVHVFLEKEREYYQLERLWKDAPLVEWEEEEKPASKRATKRSP